MFELLRPYAIAFFIGILIGIERERNQPKGVPGIGLRTFILYALIGVIIADIGNSMLILTTSFFVFMSLLLAYYRSTSLKLRRTDLGITTEVAAGFVFLLGFMAKYQPFLTITLGITTLLLLLGRQSLHQFARDKIHTNELQAAIIIIIISLGIISFLPNKTIDPWSLFNPQQFGFIILALAGIQFGGYLAIRIFGQKLGMMLTGFFGGLISSTAVVASLSSTSSKSKSLIYPSVTAAVFSIIGTLVELLIIIAMVSMPLFLNMILPVLTMILVGSSAAFFMLNHKQSKPMIESSINPLDILAICRLALLLFCILVLVSVIKQFIGEQAIYLFAFTTGLFELQAISYATAILFHQAQITQSQANYLLAIIIFSSYISKFVILWSIAHNRFAIITSTYLSLMLISGGMVFYFFH
jgi:uncharacterized membrane protein (DUF4010 family)